MNDPLAWLDEYLESLKAAGRFRQLRTRQSPHVAGLIQIDDQQLIDFSSNDYLGLSADARLVDAVRHAVGQLGWGAAASPLISGRGVLHARLERELAKLKRTESALLFVTGFAANVGTVTSLVGPGDVIFSDENNHASIIDGCRLSGAEKTVFRHRDLNDLRTKLQRRADYEKSLIVSDSVFSMDGDIAPLREICELAEENESMVMVDEAHATGVFGERGSGVCEWAGVEDRVQVRVGTLSKALGSMGGFVAADSKVIDLIVNRARPYIFSTAQPEAVSAAGIAALQIVRDEPWRRARVLEMASRVRLGLHSDGWEIGNSESPIIPVLVGAEENAVVASDTLRDAEVFVPAIRPPATPAGQSLLRISLSATHNDEQVDQLIRVFKKLRSTLAVQNAQA